MNALQLLQLQTNVLYGQGHASGYHNQSIYSRMSHTRPLDADFIDLSTGPSHDLKTALERQRHCSCTTVSKQE